MKEKQNQNIDTIQNKDEILIDKLLDSEVVEEKLNDKEKSIEEEIKQNVENFIINKINEDSSITNNRSALEKLKVEVVQLKEMLSSVTFEEANDELVIDQNINDAIAKNSKANFIDKDLDKTIDEVIKVELMDDQSEKEDAKEKINKIVQDSIDKNPKLLYSSSDLTKFKKDILELNKILSNSRTHADTIKKISFEKIVSNAIISNSEITELSNSDIEKIEKLKSNIEKLISAWFEKNKNEEKIVTTEMEEKLYNSHLKLLEKNSIDIKNYELKQFKEDVKQIIAKNFEALAVVVEDENEVKIKNLKLQIENLVKKAIEDGKAEEDKTKLTNKIRTKLTSQRNKLLTNRGISPEFYTVKQYTNDINEIILKYSSKNEIALSIPLELRIENLKKEIDSIVLKQVTLNPDMSKDKAKRKEMHEKFSSSWKTILIKKQIGEESYPKEVFEADVKNIIDTHFDKSKTSVQVVYNFFKNDSDKVSYAYVAKIGFLVLGLLVIILCIIMAVLL